MDEEITEKKEIKEKSFKEERVRKMTHLYYSNPEIQKAIYNFSKDREVVPRYFEGFGKRPDSLQYPGDVYESVKRGATSFHCSEELWKDALELSTNMNEKQVKELRKGWDLLIDIDSKYIDYSKIAAELITDSLVFHGVKNFGIKFSGNKGFHIIVPWKAFPKEINGVKTSEMFPEWPRIISLYLTDLIKNKLIEKITQFTNSKKYIKDFTIPEKVTPDIILVSSRHLFRAPYSLHEKTSLASAVIEKSDIKNFQLNDGDPLKVKIKDFIPNCKEGEASELLMQALDWHKENNPKQNESEEKRDFEFKPIKLTNLSESAFPPSIQKILKGMEDGKKRALFILINFFRSIGMEREELEKRISEWNEKNKPTLQLGYIKTQILWSYRNKIIPPPNYDKDYYKGIGVIPSPEELKFKNPVNYMVKKSKNK